MLRAKVETETFAAAGREDLPCLLGSVTFDPASGRTTVLALNRHATDELALEVELRGFRNGFAVEAASELHHDHLKATNRVDAPDEVAPADLEGAVLDGGKLRAKLKPLSWNVIVLKGQ